MTTGTFGDIRQKGLYPDLLREFMKNGHEVCVISACEKRQGLSTEFRCEDTAKHLKVRIGNLTKTNLFEKGISTIMIGRQYKMAINKYLSDTKFDLILYSTPPITLATIITYIKKRDGAISYLMLKDIFPQNAVDIGILKKNGIKGFIYRYFRAKEKKLYEVSDYIGCMSQANVEYLLKNNPEVDEKHVEICPNSIEVQNLVLTEDEIRGMRDKYGIPTNKTVFVYGGNLGKPQGIPFLVECLKSQINNSKVFFLIVGDGTEFNILKNFFVKYKPTNMKLMRRLPKVDYDRMIVACDVGMIFLDHRFTIPNFPSRLLSYMQAKLPVLAVTDSNTDIGDVVVEGGFGWWCESNDVRQFEDIIDNILKSDLVSMGITSWNYLNKKYKSNYVYQKIVKRTIK